MHVCTVQWGHKPSLFLGRPRATGSGGRPFIPASLSLRPPAPWIVAALHGLRVDRAHVGGSGEGGEEREEAGFTRYRAARRGGSGGGKEGGE